jgi:mannose-1-phosphate guanylyltransferase
MPKDRIVVATIAEQVEALQKQAPMLPESSFLIEPAPRGTASVVGLGAIVLHNRHGDSAMACLPADHFIENENRFRECLMAAYEVARDGHLVTLGLTPTYPATGYGYIRYRESLGKYRDFEAFVAESFTEKPTTSLAEEYLAEGGYAWNSGMFIWRTDKILEEIELQMKDLHQGLNRIADSIGTPQETEILEGVWQGLKSQTVDYGIMEGARRVAMIAADALGWCDIGGWSGLRDLLDEDEKGNLILAESVLAIDSEGSLVFQELPGKEERLIALLGVKDLILVDTGDAILVCPRDRAEDVRKLVQELKREGRDNYL